MRSWMNHWRRRIRITWIIHLFYYEDYTTAKIAALLRLKESTVRAQLTRARAMLREQLKGDWDGF